MTPLPFYLQSSAIILIALVLLNVHAWENEDLWMRRFKPFPNELEKLAIPLIYLSSRYIWNFTRSVVRKPARQLIIFGLSVLLCLAALTDLTIAPCWRWSDNLGSVWRKIHR